MKNQTPLGKEVKKFVEGGALVPDEVVTKIIENRLTKSKENSNGYMLDGFPRTKTQAEDLDKITVSAKKPIDYAIYFESTLSIIIQRLTGRRVCRKCGALFHAVNKLPKKQGVCDLCGGELYQRSDDNEETIKKRMAVYETNTQPIIDYYKKQSKLIRVDADKDAVFVKNCLMEVFSKDGKLDTHKVERRH
jgi:adenylate kinase